MLFQLSKFSSLIGKASERKLQSYSWLMSKNNASNKLLRNKNFLNLLFTNLLFEDLSPWRCAEASDDVNPGSHMSLQWPILSTFHHWISSTAYLAPIVFSSQWKGSPLVEESCTVALRLTWVTISPVQELVLLEQFRKNISKKGKEKTEKKTQITFLLKHPAENGLNLWGSELKEQVFTASI